jgi:surface antigen
MYVGRVGVMALVALALAGCAGETRFGSASSESSAYTVASAPPDVSPPDRTISRVAGPASPAVVKNMLGSRIGSVLDDEDRTRAYVAQMQALDNGAPGAPVGWNNENSGRHGTVVPGPAYQRNALTCRQYTHTVFIDSKPQVSRGAACRSPDGNWAATS